MRKSLFAIPLFLLCHFQSNAAIRTVSNNPATLAQFGTIQAAVNASANGDTVYVHGSPIAYSAFNLDGKGLVFFGPGWQPDKNLPLRAEVGAVNIFGSNTANSEFNGLTFLSQVNFNQNASAGDADGGTPQNVRFIRCEFRSSINFGTSGINNLTYQNYLFEGCYFNGAGLHAVNTAFTYTNFLFRNNLMRNIAFTQFFQTNNFLFDHNLFYGSGSFVSSRFMQFTNNIFNKVNLISSSSNLTFSTFTNNLTFDATNNSPWTQNDNIDGGGNIANQNPQMADQTAANAGTANPLLNFTIASGPANNAGTDGKDLGLLFDNTGSLNWTNSRNSRLPRIFSMNITNPTVAPGNNLNVSVEARVSN